MALQALSVFEDAMEAFFADPGDNEADAISGWGLLISNFTTAIVPATTAQAAARTSFEAALVGFSVSGTAIAKLTSAFTAHAAALAGGMGGLGIVPPSPIPLAPAVASNWATHAAAAAVWAPIIDTWYRTGTISGGGNWS